MFIAHVLRGACLYTLLKLYFDCGWLISMVILPNFTKKSLSEEEVVISPLLYFLSKRSSQNSNTEMSFFECDVWCVVYFVASAYGLYFIFIIKQLNTLAPVWIVTLWKKKGFLLSDFSYLKGTRYDTGRWGPQVGRCPKCCWRRGQVQVAPDRVKRLGQSRKDTES